MVKNKIRIIKFLVVASVLFFFGGGITNAQSVTVSLPNLQGQAPKQVYIPVTISTVVNGPITSYGFSVKYDPAVIVLDTIASSYYDSASGTTKNSLSVGMSSLSGKSGNVLNIGSYGMNGITTNDLPLIYIKAHYIASGVSTLTLQDGHFNSGKPVFTPSTTGGNVTVASLTVSFPTVSVTGNYHKGDVIDIPLTLNAPINSANVTGYQFKFNYDTTKIKFTVNNVITTGTVSDGASSASNYTALGNVGTGNVSVAANGSPFTSSNLVLVKLRATILQKTTANSPIALSFVSFAFNNSTPSAVAIDGSIYTVNRKPSLVVTPKPATVNAGSALTITVATADSDAEAVISYAQNIPTGGIVAAAYNTTTGKFTWTPDYTQTRTAPYVVTFFATDGTDTVSVADSITVNGYNISGKIAYANTAKTPVKNVTVTIKKSDNTTVAAVSDTAGNYSFAGLLQGTYILSYAKTDEFGGVNASDALAVLRSTIGDVLSGIQNLAADVNNDGKVNSTDALLILKRYVGSISSYPNGKADWSFLGATSDTVVVSTVITHNVSALVSGDVNASYYGTVSKSIATNLSSNSVLKISPKASFEIPVTASMLSELGSISMKIDYAANLANFAGLTANQELSNLAYSNNAKDGVLSIAWVDLNVGKSTVKLSDNSVLFTLKFTATDNFKNGSNFTLKLEGTSELTTSTGAQIEKSSVSAPSVEVAVPASFSVKQNYPNPFNPSTTIAYDIPVSGHVSLVVFNLLGQKVATVLDQVQEAGTYKIVWDASKLASGTYIYTMSVDGASQKYVSNKKMILMK